MKKIFLVLFMFSVLGFSVFAKKTPKETKGVYVFKERVNAETIKSYGLEGGYYYSWSFDDAKAYMDECFEYFDVEPFSLKEFSQDKLEFELSKFIYQDDGYDWAAEKKGWQDDIKAFADSLYNDKDNVVLVAFPKVSSLTWFMSKKFYEFLKKNQKE